MAILREVEEIQPPEGYRLVVAFEEGEVHSGIPT
jgi:hypothetical protein